MIPGIPAGRRGAARLIRLGLPGAIALLVLAATIAADTASRPAAAARNGYDWVTSWSASPQDPIAGHARHGRLPRSDGPRHHLPQRRRQHDPARADERLRPVAAAGRPRDGGGGGPGRGGGPRQHPPGELRRQRVGPDPGRRGGPQRSGGHAGVGPAGTGGEHLPAGPDRLGHPALRMPSRSTGCRRPGTTPPRRGRTRS